MAVIFGTIIFYEIVKHLALLQLKNRLRWGMFILFVSTIFSHYYTWWAYINYWDFDCEWYRQLFFTLMELISTTIVIYLADKKNSVTQRKIFVIIGITVLHILAGGWDQAIDNLIRIIKSKKFSYQVYKVT